MKEETFKSIFKTSKPIIGMAHFRALPGSPLYDKEAGINDKAKSQNVVQEIMNMFQNTTGQKDLLGGFLGQATKKMDLNPFD